MGYCKNCNYWDPSDGECNKPDYLEDEKERVEREGFALWATAADDWNLACGLRTGPMFGCVKFEPRTLGRPDKWEPARRKLSLRMLELEKQGVLSEAEYATYKSLLDALDS